MGWTSPAVGLGRGSSPSCPLLAKVSSYWMLIIHVLHATKGRV